MIPIETAFLFVIASAALAFAPGPDNIFVVTQSAIYGRRAGLMVTLGLCTGLFVHTAIVAMGVAAVFQTSVLAFNVLKIVGAVYLLYLAWQAFHAKATELDDRDNGIGHWAKLYSRGVVMNITNPKVAIFFLAFLPQFTDPSIGAVSTQMLVLGGLFIVTALLVFGSIAWMAGFIGNWLKQSPGAQVVLNRVAGTIFAGLALRLVLSER